MAVLPRRGVPEDMVKLSICPASPEGDFVTRQVINVDGDGCIRV